MHTRVHLIFFPLSRDNPVAAKLLIEAGADVNVKEFRGVTPIMMAAALGHAETLEAILASPVANVNIQVSVVAAILCPDYIKGILVFSVEVYNTRTCAICTTGEPS